MRIDFEGKVVAVTGAGHGLGRAMARDFADLGAHVFACDLSAEEMAQTAEGRDISTDAFDLTAKGAARNWIAEVERRAGAAIDILLCNAGGVRGQAMRPVEDVPTEDWHALFDINLHACFELCAAVAPGMKARGRGAIVTISSTAGLRASLTGIQAYCAAKHGLVGLTKQLAQELGPHGIRVNSIAPGFIPSNAASIRQFEAYGEEGQRKLLESIPLRMVGEEQDISNAALFLASDKAKWITGQILAVTGGL